MKQNNCGKAYGGEGRALPQSQTEEKGGLQAEQGKGQGLESEEDGEGEPEAFQAGGRAARAKALRLQLYMLEQLSKDHCETRSG